LRQFGEKSHFHFATEDHLSHRSHRNFDIQQRLKAGRKKRKNMRIPFLFFRCLLGENQANNGTESPNIIGGRWSFRLEKLRALRNHSF
jgi:hypothetical protein